MGKRQTEAEVIAAVRELERARDNGTVRKPGRALTVEQWLTQWVETIAKPSVRYKAYRAYCLAVYHHLIPALGGRRVQ